MVRGEVDILCKVSRKDFVDNVTFEQRAKGSEGTNDVEIEGIIVRILRGESLFC